MFDSGQVACYSYPFALSQRRFSHASEARLRTLGSFFLALQAQGEGTPESALNGDILGLVSGGTPVSWAVLAILLIFSVTSLGIVLYKFLTFGRSARQTKTFLDVFRRSSKFSEVQAVCPSLAASPLVGMFQAGYAELNLQLRQGATHSAAVGGSPAAVPARPTLKSLTAVDRALLRAASIEVNKLEHGVSFLATTASITPFIGLFGTVWGIMSAFQGIASVGSTNLGVVAPGIADALVATAAGLFAAIPAVFFYNLFSRRIKLSSAEMDDFALEFLNIADRNFT
ncbi:MAG: MotA/TolQ/ExbB proton channel family protein [Vicinamibacterales bacterium]